MDLVKTTRNVARVFLSRFRSVSLYKMCRFYVNTYNNDMDCYFFTNGEYRLAKNLIPRCDIVFDIGAATGEWSKMALSIRKDIQLHAFEPSLERYNTILSCGLPITANQFALGKEKSQSTLYYGTVGGSNSLHPSIDTLPNQRKEIVNVKTIDSYCHENEIKQVNYIKIDVEGHELDVLKGAKEMLQAGKIDYIQFEYGPNYIDANCLLKNIFDFVTATNPVYKLNKVLQNRVLEVREYAYPYENFLNSTWLISRLPV